MTFDPLIRCYEARRAALANFQYPRLSLHLLNGQAAVDPETTALLQRSGDDGGVVVAVSTASLRLIGCIYSMPAELAIPTDALYLVFLDVHFTP